MGEELRKSRSIRDLKFKIAQMTRAVMHEITELQRINPDSDNAYMAESAAEVILGTMEGTIPEPEVTPEPEAELEALLDVPSESNTVALDDTTNPEVG